MSGVCVERYVHLAQTTGDLDGIAMRMRGKAIKMAAKIMDFLYDAAAIWQR